MAMRVRYTVVDGEVIAEKRSGARKLYVPDPLGSTVALVDNTQAQTDTFSYWPYGEQKSRSGMTATPFQFVGTKGYYHDSANRNYVRARYLDVQKGRWLTTDPVGFDGGDLNLYRYVIDRPVGYADSSGNRRCEKPCGGFWGCYNLCVDSLCRDIAFPPKKCKGTCGVLCAYLGGIGCDGLWAKCGKYSEWWQKLCYTIYDACCLGE